MDNNKVSIVRKILNETKDDGLDWEYRYENDIYYEPDKEQYITQYNITNNKIISISITKYIMKYNYNLYINLFLNSFNNEKFENKHIETIYFQYVKDVFELFAYIKYYNSLNDKKFLNLFKNSLYQEHHNWLLVNENIFKLVLEENKFNNDKIYLIVLKNTIVIYFVKNKDNRSVLRIIKDQKLFDFLKNNYKNEI